MSRFIDGLSLLTVTCAFGELKKFVDQVESFLAHGKQINRWEINPQPLDLKSVYFPRPQAGGAEPLRVAMWSPKALPRCTGIYVNSSDGWGHFLNRFARNGSPATLSIRSSFPDEKQIQEVVYRREDSRRYEPSRIIQSIFDGKRSKRVKLGSPLDFESQNELKFSRIETRTVLLDYCRHLGVNFDDDDFWSSDAEAFYFNEEWLPDE